MVDLEFSFYKREAKIGYWLEQNMPNPPLPDSQLWSVGVSDDGRSGIQFANNRDATLFLLRWSK